MKLEGQKLTGVESCMKAVGGTTTIYLEPRAGENVETVKSSLQKRYQMKVLNEFPLPPRLLVEVPTENLRKVVEESYIANFDWPQLVEEVEGIRNRIGTSL